MRVQQISTNIQYMKGKGNIDMQKPESTTTTSFVSLDSTSFHIPQTAQFHPISCFKRPKVPKVYKIRGWCTSLDLLWGGKGVIPGSLHAIDAATLPAGGFSVGGRCCLGAVFGKNPLGEGWEILRFVKYTFVCFTYVYACIYIYKLNIGLNIYISWRMYIYIYF